MKFYKRDPDAAFAGMAELTLEQIGAYTLILDLLYSRDGILPDDDVLVARMLHGLDPRIWRRIKAELMALGKLRSADGLLTANGVASTLLSAEVQSKLQQHRAHVRWTNYRKAKENNDPAMRAGNATNRQSKKKERSWAVNSGDNSEPEPDEHFGEVRQSSIGSDELAALVQAKGWRA